MVGFCRAAHLETASKFGRCKCPIDTARQGEGMHDPSWQRGRGGRSGTPGGRPRGRNTLRRAPPCDEWLEAREQLPPLPIGQAPVRFSRTQRVKITRLWPLTDRDGAAAPRSRRRREARGLMRSWCRSFSFDRRELARRRCLRVPRTARRGSGRPTRAASGCCRPWTFPAGTRRATR